MAAAPGPRPPADRAALVLGGTGYVGSAVVRALRREGCPVAFTSRRGGERAEAIVEETGAAAVSVDLAQEAGVEAAFDAAERALGRPLDVVVAAAGGVPGEGEEAGADLDALYRVEVRATYLAVRSLVRRLPAGQEADVAVLGSVSGLLPLPAPPGFSAVQAAKQGLVRALAKEIGPRGVRVNLVALGVLDGGISRGLAPSLLEDFKRYAALRRTGSADDAAAVVRWLVLEPGYTTGATVQVSGGL